MAGEGAEDIWDDQPDDKPLEWWANRVREPEVGCDEESTPVDFTIVTRLARSHYASLGFDLQVYSVAAAYRKARQLIGDAAGQRALLAVAKALDSSGALTGAEVENIIRTEFHDEISILEECMASACEHRGPGTETYGIKRLFLTQVELIIGVPSLHFLRKFLLTTIVARRCAG